MTEKGLIQRSLTILVQWIFIMKLYRLQIISSLIKRDPHGTDLSSSILIVPVLLKDIALTKLL